MTDRHQTIKNILEKQLENGRLAHAYLFVGPKGTGKKNLAVELAGKVLAVSSRFENTTPSRHRRDTPPILGGDELRRHPDYAVLDCSQDASADSVREFIGKVFLRPFIAKRKFAVLWNIENLNAQGANALLKTLEEPPENTVMVLTADTRKVLPTIMSRCQVFSFNRNIHASRGPHPGLLPPGEGNIGIANFAGKTLSERLIAVNHFADLEEQELKQSIENFIYESAAMLSSAPEEYHHLAAGLKAYEDLNTNKNRKLILQGLMTKI